MVTLTGPLNRALKLSLLLLLAAAPAAAQLTEQETAFLGSCSANISQKIYDPSQAEKCLAELDDNDHALLGKAMNQDDIKTARLMADMNAVKDLGDFYRDADGAYIIYSGLVVRLDDADPCVLCQLQLGPQPDKLYPWVNKYAPEKLDDTKLAARDWGKLNPGIQQLLSGYGRSEQAWTGLAIKQREAALKAAATRKYNELLPPGARMYDAAANADTVKTIWPYLDDTQRTRINEIHDRINKTFEEAIQRAQASGQKNGEAEKKYAEMQEKFKGLKTAGGDNSGLLGKTFDNADAGSGAPGEKGGKTPGKSFKLTDAQAAKLAPRLQKALVGPKGELSDTPIGKEAIAFLSTKEGKLKFSVMKMDSDSTGAAFYPSTSEVKINKTFIEAAMQANNVSAEELMDAKNPAGLNKVTRYVAPTFIHEYDGHQKQTAWAVKNNIPDHYYIGQETEAFSKGALFVLQKKEAEIQKGNPWYSLQISESDVNMAKTLKNEGTPAVGRSVMYYDVPSREGVAAQNFAKYEDLKKQLTLRQLEAAKNPAAEAARDKKRPKSERTGQLEKDYNSIYPWYKESIKKNAEEAKYFQKALDEVDRQQKSNFQKYVMPDLA